ncbi:hypothetical protein AV540_00055 [Brevibacillus parabrevis]|uniref:hypothetical protein n=1 Tax=Brevibacillus parabrevis TaxID=54914 RepID=UPI0007AC0C2A|nr:hypothetical protein [Brevibacillus parabrevis]KZE55781.1 hypothetical protein AV540_00055 [Brevibacillus parabrevis]
MDVTQVLSDHKVIGSGYRKGQIIPPSKVEPLDLRISTQQIWVDTGANYAYMTNGDTIERYSMQDGKRLWASRYTISDGSTAGQTFHGGVMPDGTFVGWCSFRSTITYKPIINTAGGSQIKPEYYSDYINSMAVLPDNRVLIYLSGSNAVPNQGLNMFSGSGSKYWTNGALTSAIQPGSAGYDSSGNVVFVDGNWQLFRLNKSTGAVITQTALLTLIGNGVIQVIFVGSALFVRVGPTIYKVDVNTFSKVYSYTIPGTTQSPYIMGFDGDNNLLITDQSSSGSWYKKCMRVDNTQSNPTGLTEISVVSSMFSYENALGYRVVHNKAKKYYFWGDYGRKISETSGYLLI